MAVKSFSRAQKKTQRVLGVLAVVSILSGLAACTQQVTTTEPDWRTKMSNVPLPKKGCFKAAYPTVEWREVICITPPNQPYPPARGRPGAFAVGNGNDYAAEVTGLMNSATGSFPTVTGVTSETGNAGGVPPAVANTYSLQLNTKPFTSSVCTGHPLCKGWQQFIFSNAGSAFIQYWLLQFNATCPAGWNTYPFPGTTDIYCWENGPNAVAVATQAITNLASLSLTGNANAGGTDSVIMTTAGGNLSAANQDSILGLASAWQGVEFILVGDCCNSQALFNANSTVVVKTTVHNGTTNAPSCVVEGFTGETNNLTLVGAPALATGASPAIETQQTNIAGTAASCAAAAGIGDTHLRTFNGLFYDFQATGDFLLAQASDFAVQTRQVSGAPTWPDASLNHAVATRMGSTRVALCVVPARLAVDGRLADLADGKTLSLPSGVDVFRTGNVYLVTDLRGNSMRAVMNDTWIDVSVGLGTWPTNVRGLLANANGNVNQLAMSDGTVLSSPLSFQDLYHRYGDSWRVAPADSMLSNCGQEIQRGIPAKSFFASDLPQTIRDRARGICTQAGVKIPALLDACTLDIAVLGSEKAAAVYVGLPAPTGVGKPG